jgi:O-antigen/teichoic acid export membrane protein
VGANIARLAYAWHLSRTRFIREGLSRDWRRMWYILKESFPLGLNLILRRLIWRGGIVMMTNLLNQRAPGTGDLASGLLYGPLRLVEQMRIVPTALVGAMLPVFAQQARTQPRRFRKTLADSYKLLMVLSFLLTVVISAQAVPITRIALGPGLIAAAGVLAVFGWTVPVSFANQFYESALLAVGRQRAVASGLVIGFLVSLALSWFYLIPVHQAMGVAYAILIAEAIAFIAGFAAMLPYVDAKMLAVGFGKMGLACGAAVGVFYLLRDVTFWVSAPAGMLVFVIATLLARTFGAKELEAILTMITFHKRLRWIRHRIFGLPEAAPSEPPAGAATEGNGHGTS